MPTPKKEIVKCLSIFRIVGEMTCFVFVASGTPGGTLHRCMHNVSNLNTRHEFPATEVCGPPAAAQS